MSLNGDSDRPSGARRILLVEDERAHARLVERTFERSHPQHELRVVATLAEARAEIASRSYDLAIVDLALPDGRGTDLISDDVALPVVIIAGQGGEQVAVEVMKSGALDYVVKDEATLSNLPHLATRALREWNTIVAGRRAEEALRQSEERHRAITEHAYDLIAELDADGVIRFVSPNLEDVLGLRPTALIGRHATERVHDDDRSRIAHGLREVDTHGVTSFAAYRFRHANGSWRWLESTARSYRAADGEVLAVVSSRDVTERRELEEQLRQSQKLEAVGQLAGGIAHDFNNLLTVITGYSEFLVEMLDPRGEEFEAAQQIYAAAERSATLTRQLLAFSRNQVLQSERLSVNEVVTDLAKMLWRLIGEDILLDVDLDPGVGAVRADRGQLEQVVVNLALNARDAMPDGGQLTIATRVDAERGGMEIRVEDTGHGMDDATRARIFEPFFTTKEVGQGTGLGLSTVYGIVRQSGGDIRVDSEVGRGSLFVVSLPHVAGVSDYEAPGEASAPLDGGDETILLVEDDGDVRSLLMETLTRHGYHVLDASDSNSALARSREHEGTIDLLLTDVVLPGMDGPPLAERLVGERPDLRVLFMSGYTDREGGTSSPIPRDARLLRKPFRLRDLASEIRAEIEGD